MTMEIEFCSSKCQHTQEDKAGFIYGFDGVSRPVLLGIYLHILSGIVADLRSKTNSYRSQSSTLGVRGLCYPSARL
jgi:hypothetical protein